LDAEHAGTADWNPLGEIVHPGDVVLLKPNLVRHFHGFGWDPTPIVTHAAVVRAVLDYVELALGGSGSIIIADAPLQTTNFEAVVELAGLRALASWCASSSRCVWTLMDLRLSQARIGRRGHVVGHLARPGDDAGYSAIDLGAQSCLAPIEGIYAGFRVTNYDPCEMRQHHHVGRHEYLVSQHVLNADVVINLPKLKTHRKVGVTAALKNLIGINGHKDWLPHHRRGSVMDGGDEYRDRNRWKRISGTLLDIEESQTNPVRRQLARAFRRAAGGLSLLTRSDPFQEGSWWGNDTLWRTVLDLNRILRYADRAGQMRDKPQRRVFAIVDGIIAGEGEGPLEPTAKPCGLVIAGQNAVCVDAVAARLMGFDYRRIPIISRASALEKYRLLDFDLDTVEVRAGGTPWDQLDLLTPGPSFSFMAADGWRGAIELSPATRRVRGASS
jgi:uncharacterized protein (DUF362 family)